MRLQYCEARAQRVDETVAPLTLRHSRGRGDVFGGEVVVEREHYGLFAREVTVEESRADARVVSDIAERRRDIAALCHQLDRRVEQTPSRLGPLGRSARWPSSPPWYLWCV